MCQRLCYTAERYHALKGDRVYVFVIVSGGPELRRAFPPNGFMILGSEMDERRDDESDSAMDSSYVSLFMRVSNVLDKAVGDGE